MSSIDLESDTTEDAAAHDALFRAKTAVMLDSEAPIVPHDQVMADMSSLLDGNRGAADRLAR